MLSNEKYLVNSVLNGLIYLESLKTFCVNIRVAFLHKNEYYIDTAIDFYNQCQDLIVKFLKYANHNLSKELLDAKVIVTNYTLPATLLTEKLFGIELQPEIIEEKLKLESGVPKNISDEEALKIEVLNDKALIICRNLRKFLREIFNNEVEINLFAYTSPFAIRNMIEETIIYILVLERLKERRETTPTFATETEYKPIYLLRSFAIFIRSTVDASREDIIVKAQAFIVELTYLSEEYATTSLSPYSQEELTKKGKKLLERFTLFLEYIIKELLEKQVFIKLEAVTLDGMYRTCHVINYFIFSYDAAIEKKENQ